MLTWNDFANAEPELAEAGRSLLCQFGVGLAFLASFAGIYKGATANPVEVLRMSNE